MTKPNWNRLAALEFAGRILAGRTDIRAGEAQAHADWALQWLGGDLPNSERPPASGGWIGPANVPADTILVRTATDGLAAARRRFLGRDETAPGLVEHLDGNPRNNRPENLTGTIRPPDPEAPPRNVPTEGDGSMAVPIYRFWIEAHSDWDRPYVRYWREDTRNRTNRWSMWIAADDDRGVRWASLHKYDDPRFLPADLKRIRLGELPDGIPAETRFDTED